MQFSEAQRLKSSAQRVMSAAPKVTSYESVVRNGVRFKNKLMGVIVYF
jgi:hypothetical protein